MKKFLGVRESQCEENQFWGNMTIEDSLKDKRRNQFIIFAVSGEF